MTDDSSNRVTSNHFALLGGLKRRGQQWRAAPRMLHVAAVGGVNLDLTTAELPAEVELTSVAIAGGAELTVPDSLRMEVSGFRLVGGVSGDTGGTADGTLLRLRVFSLFGGVSIRRVPDRP